MVGLLFTFVAHNCKISICFTSVLPGKKLNFKRAAALFPLPCCSNLLKYKHDF